MKTFIIWLLFPLIALGADKKISELNSLGHASFNSSDLLVIVDVGADETKNTTLGDFDFRYFLKGTDVLPITSGGTGLNAVPSLGNFIYSNGSSFLSVGSACTAGQVLLSNGSGVWSCGSAGGGTVNTILVGTGMTGGGSSSTVTIGVNSELQGLSGLSALGVIHRTGSGTYSAAAVDLTADVSGILPTANLPQSTTSSDGYLSSTDWNTFNGKQSAGNYITALTGDVTASGPGSASSLVAKLQGTPVSNTAPTTGQVLTFDGTNWLPATGGGSGTPGGSDTQIQFNNAGSFGGDSGMTYNGSQVTFSLVDSFGGLKVLGRTGGEPSISMQPDSVADGGAGQWIMNTNGSGLANQNDFAIYDSELSAPVVIMQSATGFAGFNTNNPNHQVDVNGDIGAHLMKTVGDHDTVGGGNANDIFVNVRPSADDSTNYSSLFNFGVAFDPDASGFQMGSGIGVINANTSWAGTGTLGDVNIFAGGGEFGDGTNVASIHNYNTIISNPTFHTNISVNGYTSLGAFPEFDLGTTTSGINLIDLNPTLNGAVTGFAEGVGIFPNFGASSVTAHYHAIENGGDANTTGSIGDYINYNGYINHGTFTGSFTGIQFTPSDDAISGAVELGHFSINNSTIGDDSTLFGVDGGSITVASGKTIRAINVDLSGYTSDQQKSGLSINDGSLEVESNYDTSVLSASPGEFQMNLIGGELHIASGNPISSTFGFGNNIGPAILAEDSMGADNALGSGNSLGFNVNGLVNQVAVVSGKTIDTLNYMTAGAGIPSASTGGAITNLSLFKAIGLLPEGGTLSVTNLKAFEVNPLIDASGATNEWGLWVGAMADNWMAKDLVIGGSTGKPVNGGALEVTGAVSQLNAQNSITTTRPVEQTLAATTGSPTNVTDLAWASGGFSRVDIDYSMIEKSTGAVRAGKLSVIQQLASPFNVYSTDTVFVSDPAFPVVILSATNSSGVKVQFTNASANDILMESKVTYYPINNGSL